MAYPIEKEVLYRYRRCQFAPGGGFQLILKIFHDFVNNSFSKNRILCSFLKGRQDNGCEFTVTVILSCVTTEAAVCCGEPQTRTHGLGSRFWFHVKPVVPSHPLQLLPVPQTHSLPLTLVASSEPSTSKWSRTSKSCSPNYTTKIRALYMFWVEVRGVYKVRTCSSMKKSLWTKCLCCMCYRLVY